MRSAIPSGCGTSKTSRGFSPTVNAPKSGVTVAYYALVSLHEHRPEPASFAGSVHWVDVHEIPELAFDHNAIVERAFDTLRDSLDTHRVSFELLPKKFTLSQLQGLYEIVLNKKFDKRNFRKNVKRMSHVVPLD